MASAPSTLSNSGSVTTLPASVFGSAANDQAIAGILASTTSTLTMHPLDLVKVRLQVSHTANSSISPRAIFGHILSSWRVIIARDGPQGLYRGISPNLIANATSWGTYFWIYTQLKRRQGTQKLSTGQYLVASSQAGVCSALLSNPLWLIKTRMFTTSRRDNEAYTGVYNGMKSILRNEGVTGLWRGTLLALVGVGNGALQFATYETLKQWRFEWRLKKTGQVEHKLPNLDYLLFSAASKSFSLSVTYPYQVLRARIQNTKHGERYPTIRTCIAETYRGEGIRGFYRGLTLNLIRVLPGTCVVFLVYENLTAVMREYAQTRTKLNIAGKTNDKI